jgi:hypothetical protein
VYLFGLHIYVAQILWQLLYFSKFVASRSLVITPHDFYLWRFMENNVFQNKSGTLEEL